MSPTTPRTCALIYMQLGNTPRARDFAQLDAGSEWFNGINAYFLLRAGDAAGVARQGNRFGAVMRLWWPMFMAYMEHKPEADVARLAQDAKRSTLAVVDGEPPYFTAEVV